MNLPIDNQPWPPPEYAPALEQVRKDAAWLTGDMAEIRQQVEGEKPKPYVSRAQFNGGLVGATARGVLGRPNMGGSVRVERHLPVAAELVTISANLLAEKPPAVSLHEDDATNTSAAQALDDLTSTDLFAAEWWEACYNASGHGWVFGRVVWNVDVQPHPWIEWVDGDQGYAEFRNGRQVSVTFWDTFKDGDGKKVWRLLQKHTTGRIEYGLYEGTEEKLGRRVPVTEHPATEYLADLLDAESSIMTGITGLTARMFRNLEKNPNWRHHPQLRYYGHSDVSKGGGLWADIDMAWTNLMNDVESGRGRLLVSEEFLTSGGPGQGQVFDWMRDVYPLAQGGSPDAAGTIEKVQFDMRVEENTAAVSVATMKAVDAVGLSHMTVGMDPQATGDMTATETRARSDKTIKTAGGKARQSRAELSELLTAYIQMDAAMNNYPAPARPVNVAIVEPVQDTDEDRARRAKSLREADAASTYYLVRDLHPEWTEPQVEEEVARIIQERQAGMPVDPFNVGADMSLNPSQLDNE